MGNCSSRLRKKPIATAICEMVLWSVCLSALDRETDIPHTVSLP